MAWSTLTDTLDLQCKQLSRQINCEYRSIIGKSITNASAKVGKRVMVVSPLNKNKNSIALLLVVDTSDPRRKNVIEQNKKHIKLLLSKIEPDFAVGLASFDKEFRIETPIGTSSFLLSKSLEKLRAIGKTTELYRSLIKAVEYIATFNVSRKVIILFSDGQAEDKAYFHSDVIKIARDAGVIINSIGYPRSASLSVALQTLRRLSEETGGKYVATNLDYELPDSYFNTPFDNVMNGGNFTIELNDFFQKNLSEKITLEFSGSGSHLEKVQIPVDTDLLNRYPRSKSPVTEKGVSQVPVKTETKKTNSPSTEITPLKIKLQSIHPWLWYGIFVAFSIAIVSTLVILFLLWQQRKTADKKSSKIEYSPYAYFIAQDGTETCYPVTRIVSRIGRGKGNELRLDDASVSRNHAEIHRNSDGSFDIKDMNSRNGVYVNKEKISQVQLQEGDIIEIGNISLEFTRFLPNYSSEEEATVMQKTKTPSITY